MDSENPKNKAWRINVTICKNVKERKWCRMIQKMRGVDLRKSRSNPPMTRDNGGGCQKRSAICTEDVPMMNEPHINLREQSQAEIFLSSLGATLHTHIWKPKGCPSSFWGIRVRETWAFYTP